MATESQIAAARRALESAQQSYAEAKPGFVTKAGASVLPTTGTPTAGDVSAARYTAMAAGSGQANVFGTDSKISVEAQSQPYLQAISTASGALSNLLKEEPTADNNADAFALLKNIFTSYGLESLIPDIENYMTQGYGPEQATLALKQTAAYKTRFAGNEKRRSSGLNVLSEAEYLSLEDAYTSTLKSYGQQNFLGTDRATRQAQMANIIGADISAVEFKDRVDMAVTRVQQADPEIKTQLKAFYNIGDVDLVGYFLNPTEGLPALQEKVKTAEIGSAAVSQGLQSTYAAAVDLAKYGVDLATARQGYATIAEQLPTTQKLASIYAEEGITYGQAQAEAETFKGLASEKRKRQALAAKETASFSGSSGTSKGAFSSNYLNRQTSAGQF